MSKNKAGKIIASFKTSSLALLAVCMINKAYEKIEKPERKISNTLVPGAVMAFYAVCIGHLYLYQRVADMKAENRRRLQDLTIFLGIHGMAIMLGALLIGGKKYKFRICAKVYSIALLAWLASLMGAYCYYDRKKIA